jgi:hypothetical protein
MMRTPEVPPSLEAPIPKSRRRKRRRRKRRIKNTSIIK